ncbi:MAG TPA: hypothetical protein VGW40_02335 [Allosphingosinicella sp.]|nr:hypothetical protein [Allosphingosinicella sp.]
MAERFERHRQAWTSQEIRKLHLLAGKGMALKALARALTRSEESIRDRAKADGLKIARLRQGRSGDRPPFLPFPFNPAGRPRAVSSAAPA